MRALLLAQDWPRLQTFAAAEPASVLAGLRQLRVLEPASGLHRAPVLVLYAELALRQGLRIEAGWALYQAEPLLGGRSALPPVLQDALRWTHPLWHQSVHGRRVSLCRPHRRHSAFLRTTLASEDFVTRYNAFLGAADAAAADYLKRSGQPAEQLRQLDWVIEDRCTGRPIGLASIADLVWAHRRGEFLLGFPEANVSARGVVEAALLVLCVAFRHLQLHKLVSYVYAHNRRAQKATLDLGFIAEGRLNRHVLLADHPHGIDLLVNGLLREDYLVSSSLSALHERLLPDFCLEGMFRLKLGPTV